MKKLVGDNGGFQECVFSGSLLAPVSSAQGCFLLLQCEEHPFQSNLHGMWEDAGQMSLPEGTVSQGIFV